MQPLYSADGSLHEAANDVEHMHGTITHGYPVQVLSILLDAPLGIRSQVAFHDAARQSKCLALGAALCFVSAR